MDFLLFQKIIWLHDYITAKLWTLITNGICLLSAVCVLSKDLFFSSTVGESCASLLLGDKVLELVCSLHLWEAFHFHLLLSAVTDWSNLCIIQSRGRFFFSKKCFLSSTDPFLERWNDCIFTFTCLDPQWYDGGGGNKRWCSKTFELIFLMFSYSSQVQVRCILVFCVYGTVLLWCSLFICHFCLPAATFQISSLCLCLQEQAHRTALEISLLVPLLIFLLHEGNSQKLLNY